MNNYHYSENIYELVELILDEQFGKTVSLVGIALLNNGPSSILELMKLLSFDFAEVRDALIILLQNKLVLFQEASRKESLEIIYELDVDTFLNYLRFPKILYFINHHHDENAMLIFEEFMQFGILSAGQVFEQVKDKLSQEGKDNPSAVNNMKLKFLQLIESGYLTQCSHKKPQELSEKKKKEDKKQMSAKKKKKAALHEDEEEKIIRNSPTSMVNAQIDDDNALIYNKEKGKYYYFCLNFDKIVIELKCEIVVDLITQKMGGQAGLISSIMLRKNAANAFREGKSTPITIEEILKQMGVNTKDKKILLDKTEAVRNLLEEMSREENDFVLLWSIIESGQTYCLNLESVSKTLKTKTLEKIIEQEFSPDHIRIYRLLSKCGPLDSKNIMEICLMPHKESSACINQMIEHGYIETQPINYKGSNVMFFNINTKSNLNLMIAKIYKVRNFKL
jgi:hypothetical protein